MHVLVSKAGDTVTGLAKVGIFLFSKSRSVFSVEISSTRTFERIPRQKACLPTERVKNSQNLTWINGDNSKQIDLRKKNGYHFNGCFPLLLNDEHKEKKNPSAVINSALFRFFVCVGIEKNLRSIRYNYS